MMFSFFSVPFDSMATLELITCTSCSDQTTKYFSLFYCFENTFFPLYVHIQHISLLNLNNEYVNCTLLGYYAVCSGNSLPTFPINPTLVGQESKKNSCNKDFFFYLFIQTYFHTSHSGTYRGNGKSHIHYTSSSIYDLTQLIAGWKEYIKTTVRTCII